MHGPQLSIVIPAFNEEARIGGTLRATRELAADIEVIVVDDGSRDRTRVVVGEAMRCDPRIRLVVGGVNRGKGHAVRVGVRNASGAIVMFCDADLATPLSEIAKAVAPIVAGETDIVIGARGAAARGTQRTHRRLMAAAFEKACGLLFDFGVTDTQCGFKVFRREAARAIFGAGTLDGFAFDLEVLLLARAQGWRVTEMPIAWTDRPGSRIEPVRASLSILRDAIGLRLRTIRARSGAARPRDRRARPSEAWGLACRRARQSSGRHRTGPGSRRGR